MSLVGSYHPHHQSYTATDPYNYYQPRFESHQTTTSEGDSTYLTWSFSTSGNQGSNPDSCDPYGTPYVTGPYQGSEYHQIQPLHHPIYDTLSRPRPAPIVTKRNTANKKDSGRAH